MSEATLYAGLGRKCSCGCFFVCAHDFEAHKRVCAELRDERLGWRKGKDGWFLPVERDPELVAAIKRNGGKASLGRFNVWLSPNGKWIVRKEVMFR